jgi:acetyltransferase-like isoleucine patch superfamily enzyme/dTDP-4-dehydrorhamnose 3,5-epimerase-like enzyme
MSDVFVHEKGICESQHVGARTRIWAFAHVLPGATIGTDCNICDNVFIENDVVVGSRVTIKSGVQLWDGVQIEDDVLVGPNATFTNDRFPRSKNYPATPTRTIVRRGASIGANATVLPGLEIGANAMIGAGAVVTRSVPPNAIAVGNPARIIGYVGAAEDVPTPGRAQAAAPPPTPVSPSRVQGVMLHRLPLVHDMRGDLSVGEFERTAPFIPKRYFLVFDVPSREIRGEHAHRLCHQFLVCVKGSCAVVVDDGAQRQEIELDRPDLGVHVPPMVWATQYKYSPDAVLLVFASDWYDPADYIRDYAEFRRLKADAADASAR